MQPRRQAGDLHEAATLDKDVGTAEKREEADRKHEESLAKAAAKRAEKLADDKTELDILRADIAGNDDLANLLRDQLDERKALRALGPDATEEERDVVNDMVAAQREITHEKEAQARAKKDEAAAQKDIEEQLRRDPNYHPAYEDGNAYKARTGRVDLTPKDTDPGGGLHSGGGMDDHRVYTPTRTAAADLGKSDAAKLLDDLREQQNATPDSNLTHDPVPAAASTAAAAFPTTPGAALPGPGGDIPDFTAAAGLTPALAARNAATTAAAGPPGPPGPPGKDGQTPDLGALNTAADQAADSAGKAATAAGKTATAAGKADSAMGKVVEALNKVTKRLDQAEERLGDAESFLNDLDARVSNLEEGL